MDRSREVIVADMSCLSRPEICSTPTRYLTDRKKTDTRFAPAAIRSDRGQMGSNTFFGYFLFTDENEAAGSAFSTVPSIEVCAGEDDVT